MIFIQQHPAATRNANKKSDYGRWLKQPTSVKLQYRLPRGIGNTRADALCDIMPLSQPLANITERAGHHITFRFVRTARRHDFPSAALDFRALSQSFINVTLVILEAIGHFERYFLFLRQWCIPYKVLTQHESCHAMSSGRLTQPHHVGTISLSVYWVHSPSNQSFS